MKALKVIGWGIVVILAIYAIWAAFIPMLIGEKIVEREVIQQSPQYVISQRSAIFRLYTEYQKTDDTAVKSALESQICEIAINLPKSELDSDIIRLCN